MVMILTILAFIAALLTVLAKLSQGALYESVNSLCVPAWWRASGGGKCLIVNYLWHLLVGSYEYSHFKSIYILGKNNLDRQRGVVALFPDDNSATPKTDGNVFCRIKIIRASDLIF